MPFATITSSDNVTADRIIYKTIYLVIPSIQYMISYIRFLSSVTIATSNISVTMPTTSDTVCKYFLYNVILLFISLNHNSN